MFIQTNNPIIGRTLATAWLAALNAAPGGALLLTPFVHLFTAGPATISPDTLPTDFTEATFVGYSSQALNLPLLGTINIDAETIARHNEENFVGGAVVAPGEMIAGYWVDNDAAAGTQMYMGERFSNPVAIAVLGDFIALDVIFAMKMAFALGL